MGIISKIGTQSPIEDEDDEMSVTEAIKESEGNDDPLLHELLDEWMQEEMDPDSWR